jgi:flagellar P-ring protein precursor FlgI
MVTTSLPAFAQPGQTIDITVSSIGNAKSLRGGTLLMTPLHGADGQVYAMAQGNVLVGGVGASSGGASGAGQSPVGRQDLGGATVERAVASNLGADNQIKLELNATDFATASRVVEAINDQFGVGIATALDGRVIRVRTPSSATSAWLPRHAGKHRRQAGRGRRQDHHERAHRFGRDEPAP